MKDLIDRKISICVLLVLISSCKIVSDSRERLDSFQNPQANHWKTGYVCYSQDTDLMHKKFLEIKNHIIVNVKKSGKMGSFNIDSYLFDTLSIPKNILLAPLNYKFIDMVGSDEFYTSGQMMLQTKGKIENYSGQKQLKGLIISWEKVDTTKLNMIAAANTKNHNRALDWLYEYIQDNQYCYLGGIQTLYVDTLTVKFLLENIDEKERNSILNL